MLNIAIFDDILTNNFIDSIWSVIKFVINLPNFILEIFSFLPDDVKIYLSSTVIIIIACFLYRFLK